MKVVRCERTYPVPAQVLWYLVRDFYDDWHPVMAWCKQEPDNVRRFGVDGESTIYREQLIYHSDDETTYRYKMLDGIADLGSYTAALVVEPTANGCIVIWAAEIEASPERAEHIATGTEAIFQMGLDTLNTLVTEQQLIETIILPDWPKLALDVAGQGELCLFLHGIGGNRTNWQGQLKALGPICQSVALDLRGYGESGLGPDDLTVEKVVADIERIMAHFEVSKIHLVGLSLGSWLAACFSHLRPEKIASLTLCAGSTGMSEADQSERDRFINFRLKPMEAGLTPSEIAEAIVEQISGPQTTSTTKAILMKSMQNLDRLAYLNALRCFLNPPFKIGFEQFVFPTLFIAGQYDKLASPDEMMGVANRVPNATFVEVAGAGHLINLDKPTEFNTVLSDFLAKIL